MKQEHQSRWRSICNSSDTESAPHRSQSEPPKLTSTRSLIKVERLIFGRSLMSLADRLAELQVAPLGDEYVPLSQAEVAELERQLGLSLPPDYLEFALAYGRCCFFEDFGAVQLVEHLRTVPVDTFFGGQASEPSVLTKREEYAAALPDGAVPIADDPLGNLYVLWVSDPKVPGSIWYLDYSGADRSVIESDGRWEVPAYLAAASFTDLLARTRVVEET
jgi:hypothetical protein